MTLDEKIAQAQRHVETGRRIVECQRVLVARHGQPSAIDLLEILSGRSRFSRWTWPIYSRGSKATSEAYKPRNPADIVVPNLFARRPH
jgi:hypothetical protein